MKRFLYYGLMVLFITGFSPSHSYSQDLNLDKDLQNIKTNSSNKSEQEDSEDYYTVSADSEDSLDALVNNPMYKVTRKITFSLGAYWQAGLRADNRNSLGDTGAYMQLEIPLSEYLSITALGSLGSLKTRYKDEYGYYDDRYDLILGFNLGARLYLGNPILYLEQGISIKGVQDDSYKLRSYFFSITSLGLDLPYIPNMSLELALDFLYSFAAMDHKKPANNRFDRFSLGLRVGYLFQF